MIKERHNDYGISNQFLNVMRYKQVAEKVRLRGIFYENYCECFERYYIELKKVADKIFQRVNKNKGKEGRCLKVDNLRAMVLEMMIILRDLSIFKIKNLTEMRERQDNIFEQVTDIMVERVKLYMKHQKQFKKQLNSFQNQHHEISIMLTNLHKIIQDKQYFYDIKFIKKYKNQLNQKLKALSNQNGVVKQKRKKITTDSLQFEKFLISYRKKAAGFMNENILKIKKTTLNMHQCLNQLIFLIYQSVKKHCQIFNSHLYKQESRRQNDTRYKIKSGQQTRNVVLCKKQDHLGLQDLLEILEPLSIFLTSFKDNKSQDKQNWKRAIFENTRLYDTMDELTNQMIEIIRMFEDFQLRLETFGERIRQCFIEVKVFNHETRKGYQIINVMNQETASRLNKSNVEIESLQMIQEVQSTQFMKDMIKTIYDNFYSLARQAYDYCHGKNKRALAKQTNNSIKISHLDSQEQTKLSPDTFLVDWESREKWLGEDWKDYDSYRISSIQQITQIATYLTKSLIVAQRFASSSKSYQCSLIRGRQFIRGKLQINLKNLEFNSQEPNYCEIIIPKQLVQRMETKPNFFEKFLAVRLKDGVLLFSQFENFKEAEENLANELQVQENEEKDVKKIDTMILTKAQIEQIEQRVKKIEPLLESRQSLTKLQDLELNGVNIVEVYQLFYSDEQITINKKVYHNFMHFMFVKLKNTDYVSSKYTPRGPKYFGISDGVSFKECAAFSQKVSSFMHPLPYIPMMPSQTKVVQKHKIEWVSHLQFNFWSQSKTSNIPYSDAFYAHTLHRVRLVAENKVIINMMGEVIFVKNPSLKAILRSKAEDQMKNGAKDVLAFFRKKLEQYIYKRDNNKSGNDAKSLLNPITIENQPDEPDQDQPAITKKDYEKMKTQNRILLTSLITVLILNLITFLWY